MADAVDVLVLPVGGDSAAALHTGRVRVEVRLGEHEPRDEVAAPVGENDRHGAAHAVRDELGPGHTGLVESGRQSIGVVVQRVPEVGGPVTDAVPRQIDEQRTPTREFGPSGDVRMVDGRGGPQPMDVHQRSPVPVGLDPADTAPLRVEPGLLHHALPLPLPSNRTAPPLRGTP